MIMLYTLTATLYLKSLNYEIYKPNQNIQKEFTF